MFTLTSTQRFLLYSESTISGWFSATCKLLTPLYNKLVEQLLKADYLQVDESPIKVLEKNKKSGKQTRTGYHWVYYAPVEKQVVFDYRPTRSRNGPQQFLSQFSETVQTDGYKAYNKLASKGKIKLLACMAHARRYFEKAVENDRKRASEALSQIGKLYEVERKIREEGLNPDEIVLLRKSGSIPILDEFKIWLDENLDEVMPKSRMGKAIRYTLSLWDRLCAYTEDERFLIDNNKVENTIRPLALGRKNYLFAGSNRGALDAAMMYSFFVTCKLNGVEPYAWLKDVLERIGDQKISQLHELLPHNWIPLNQLIEV